MLFVGVSSVHPGQMLNEINFKISLEIIGNIRNYRIKIVEFHATKQNKLDKTIKADMFINNRNWKNNRNIHSVTYSLSLSFLFCFSILLPL